MEGYPKELPSYSQIYRSLMKLRHVVNVHDLRIWSLTVDRVELTCHLVVEPATAGDAATTRNDDGVDDNDEIEGEVDGGGRGGGIQYHHHHHKNTDGCGETPSVVGIRMLSPQRRHGGDVLLQATTMLRKKYKIEATTIQLEDIQPNVLDSCTQCKHPMHLNANSIIK